MLLAKLKAGRRGHSVRRVLPSHASDSASRNWANSASGRIRCPPATTTRWKPPSTPTDQAADQRVAHQSSPERRRHRTFRQRLGKKHGIETLIDATLATPYQLAAAGRTAWITCLHSCTKYLGRTQRHARRGRHRLGREDRTGRKASRHDWARSTRRTTSTCCFAGSRPSSCA